MPIRKRLPVRVLAGGKWKPEYLEATPQPHEYLVAVTHWITVAPVEDLFFERARSISMVLDYARDIGVRPTARRIRSRRAERVRNQRFVSFGLGRVRHTSEGSTPHSRGDLVAFVSPMAPLCADHIVVHERLVYDPPPGSPAEETGHLLWVRDDRWLAPRELSGWSPWSGIELRDELVRTTGRACVSAIADVSWKDASRLRTAPDGRRNHVAGRAHASGSRPTAILFGMGNYAKTTILPNLRASLDIRAIHDVDPLQIGPQPHDAKLTWSTDPHADLTPFDAVLVAGYHHTHAPLAERALALGKSVVVEKPLATSAEQLGRLAIVAARGEGRLFVCFQRRHTKLNEYALEDLGTAPGEPINYHCVVFEEPLPSRHWYGWPTSGSRLMSNGCHWIDHFLHLNRFSPPTHLAVELGADGLVNVTTVLENGAVFTMALTDVGSRRLGVRESIELRAGDVTVRLTDGTRYEAESSRRRLRKVTVSKLAAQQRMYASIGAAITAGTSGETVAHNLLSARATLELERKLHERDISPPSDQDAFACTQA